MKLSKTILLGVAGVVAYYLYKGARLASVASKVKFLFRGISFSGLNTDVKISILNPTSEAINFTSFVGDVLIGSKTVATAKSFVPVEIRPASQTDLSITFVPSGFGIVDLISDSIDTGIKGGAAVVGYARLNGFTVPVNLRLK